MYVTVDTHMRFLWDEKKSRMNVAKHKVSFEVASLVFEDPHSISQFDRIKDGEERWQTLGVRAALPSSGSLMSTTWNAALNLFGSSLPGKPPPPTRKEDL